MLDKDELNKIASGRMKELYERISGQELKRHSNQWEGLCPVCGHTFWVSDRTPDHFYCRTCGKCYFAIDIVCESYHLTERSQFPEALRKLADLLGVTDTGTQKYIPCQVDQLPKLMETLPSVPSEEWQQAVKPAVIQAYKYLMRNDYNNPEAQYLLGRGFSKDTLRKCCIGYNPKRYSLNHTLPDSRVVEAYEGYFIPTFIRLNDNGDSDTLCRVKVRIPDSQYKWLMEKWQADPDHRNKPNKYISIRGSEGISLFGSQYARSRQPGRNPNIIYVEGEFDAMTINQCGGDICRAVTFGSHGNIGKAENWIRWYAVPEHTVICFDNDPDPKIYKAVRNHEIELLREISKAQNYLPEALRGERPAVHHLPDQYHDWNDILKLPNGVDIIRNKLTEFFQE